MGECSRPALPTFQILGCFFLRLYTFRVVQYCLAAAVLFVMLAYMSPFRIPPLAMRQQQLDSRAAAGCQTCQALLVGIPLHLVFSCHPAAVCTMQTVLLAPASVVFVGAWLF